MLRNAPTGQKMQVSHPQTLFLIQHSHNRPRSLMAMIDHGAIYYTPHLWCVECNSFDIVCVSLCVAISLSQPNGRTYRLEFWHGGQVEWYLSRVDRSRSKFNVTGSKKCSLECSIDFWEPCLWTCQRRRSGIQLAGRWRGVFSKRMQFFGNSTGALPMSNTMPVVFPAAYNDSTAWICMFILGTWNLSNIIWNAPKMDWLNIPPILFCGVCQQTTP